MAAEIVRCGEPGDATANNDYLDRHRLFMKIADNLDNSLDILYRRFGQDSMTEIHDVPGPGTSTAQQVGHFGSQLGQRSKQRDRIEVALYGRTVADIHPGLVNVDAPVYTDYVTARGVQLAKETARPCSKVDDRHTGGSNPFNQSPGVGLNVADIVLRTQGSYPAVEDLHRPSAATHL